MFSSPAITAAIIAILAALAFSGGFAVSDWRSAAEIERLNSSNAVLSAANDKCAVDIQSVRKAMDALTSTSARREKNAAMAMRSATAVAAKHTKRAKKMRALPPVAAAHQCEVIDREQIEYVKSRDHNE
ncbi:hypothetical protein [Nitrosovibrio sp. Nv6]|uniref:hypothetical protein n=1 Tax=Nitrosovibrio sp. Nv6 TaxID=1855340 RepID=UPI0008B5D0B8|nr:hypothetical protein [Nitrosovibrio sp. Nv6]SEO53429.1 hypothetical protein SAMN05216316_0434 [Nitrosovibrio sp. Nv6]